PAEEGVEADLVKARGRRVRGEVPADALVAVVRADHHGHRVPADHPPDPQLHLLIPGEVRLLLGGDRVYVPGLRERRDPNVQHPGALEQLVEDETGAVRARLLHESVEALDPLLGLVGVDVGELVLELVPDVMDAVLHLHQMVVVEGASPLQIPINLLRHARASWAPALPLATTSIVRAAADPGDAAARAAAASPAARSASGAAAWAARRRAPRARPPASAAPAARRDQYGHAGSH